MTKTEELLKVLDMPEEGQLVFVNKLWRTLLISAEFNLQPDIDGVLKMTTSNRRILAALAFRLRDEAVKEDEWRKGRQAVADYLDRPACMWDEWSKPIHWIIAALIAKELRP